MYNLKDRYLHPFTDFGFKKLFGTEENKALLIDFLNQLLGKQEGKIADLHFLSNEQLGRSPMERRAVFDIFCQNEAGEYFVVEMQKSWQDHFKERSLYYSTFPIQHQATRGDWDFALRAVYMVNLLDFTYFAGEKYRHDAKLCDLNTGEVFYDRLTYIFLEMPKFRLKESELSDEFEKWMFALKQMPKLKEQPSGLCGEIFEQLFEQAELAQLDERKYAAYADNLKVYRDLKNTVKTSFSAGLKEGIEQGIEKGIEQGIEQEKIEMARRMLAGGYKPEEISQIVGLSLDVIGQLQGRKD